ncbi:nucleotidyltransferase family protein [Paenibacillus hodogayensis]|uniref:Nucleotidyltransferase family protein n=1 Tax=Paenibacillus hodogayensis TaxID=279208 RepID=A0ABV5W461_9BACL
MNGFWSKLLVAPDATIHQTIRVIDDNARQIALVVDAQMKLLGTVTDGDIRRGMLKGLSMHDPVSHIMNASPVVSEASEGKDSLLQTMKMKKIRQIPIVDEAGRLIGLETIDGFLHGEAPRTNWVVLMAGGLGRRLRPLTDHCPKPLLKVGEKPILETIMQHFLDCGLSRFYISVHYKPDMIQNYFGDGSRWGATIRYIVEEKPLGTAGALSLITERPAEPFIVMNGDLLTKVNVSRLLDFHEEAQAVGTMGVREFDYQIPYGVVHVDRQRLLSIEEKPVRRSLVSAGIYVLEPSVLGLIPTDSYYDMPALFERLIDNKLPACAFPIREYWLDIGRLDDFHKANVEYGKVFK